MRPQEVSLTDAEATSDVIFPDGQQSAIAIGLQVTFSSAVVADGDATVEATLRDPRADDFVAADDWIAVTDFSAITASLQGNIIAPVYALRLLRGSGTAGTVTLTVLQGRTN